MKYIDLNSKVITKEFEKDKELSINIIEIKINDELINNKDLLEQLFFECHCALFLIDLTSDISFSEVKKLISTLTENEVIKNDSNYLTTILVSNKSDLDSKREINKESIDKFIESNPTFNSIEISLKENKGIDELTKKIYESYTKKENLEYPSDSIKTLEILDNQESLEFSKIEAEGLINCILIGDSGTGKSSFLIRFFRNEFSQIFLTTIGLDKETKLIKIKNSYYKLVLWDTAGQERFRSLPRKYYQNSDGIFIFFDVNKRATFKSVEKWIEDTKNSIDDTKKTNMYLIGNKIDLEREVSREEAVKLAQDKNIKYFECCNKANINNYEIMTHMIMDCYNDEKKNGKKKNVKKLQKVSTKKKKKCC